MLVEPNRLIKMHCWPTHLLLCMLGMMKHHAEFALLVFCMLAAGVPIFQARNIREIVCCLIGTHVYSMYWFTLICRLRGHLVHSGWLFKNPAEHLQLPETSAFAILTLSFWQTGPEIWPPWLPPANCVPQITTVVSQLWSLHGKFTPHEKELRRRPPHSTMLS